MKTDLQLRTDVAEELAFDPRITNKDIAIAVNDGVVTLTGRVPTFIQRLYAERAAKRVFGVRGIVENLTVELSGHHVRNDTDIAHAAIHSLDWSVLIPKDSLQVTINDGVLKLSGTVDWQYQKDAAFNEVRGILGVRDVINQIAVKPHVTPGDIRSEIEQEFRRTATIDADHISIKTNDDRVVLNGTVRSLDERDYALRGAWHAPGVAFVENNLVVAP
jgi:osmotically-inducible protein OsmY